jgi:hypothetical protein
MACAWLLPKITLMSCTYSCGYPVAGFRERVVCKAVKRLLFAGRMTGRATMANDCSVLGDGVAKVIECLGLRMHGIDTVSSEPS